MYPDFLTSSFFNAVYNSAWKAFNHLVHFWLNPSKAPSIPQTGIFKRKTLNVKRGKEGPNPKAKSQKPKANYEALELSKIRILYRIELPTFNATAFNPIKPLYSPTTLYALHSHFNFLFSFLNLKKKRVGWRSQKSIFEFPGFHAIGLQSLVEFSTLRNLQAWLGHFPFPQGRCDASSLCNSQ